MIKEETDSGFFGILMYLPNVITVSRIFFGLIIFANILYFKKDLNFNMILFLMLSSEISDFIDGMIARKYNITSKLGEILDPMSDSLYRTTVYLSFAMVGWIDFVLPLTLIYRDTLVSYIRIKMSEENMEVKARFSGKIKAFVQGLGSFFIILPIYYSNFGLASEQDVYNISITAYFIIMLSTLYSAFDYLYSYLKNRTVV